MAKQQLIIGIYQQSRLLMPKLGLHEKNLKTKYDRVNEHIHSGENTSLKIQHNKQSDIVKWTLPLYPA